MRPVQLLVFKLCALLIVLVASVSIASPASAAAISTVEFRYSSRYGGSIIAKRCVTGKWNWLSTTELSGRGSGQGPRELGSWKWPESQCREHYAVVDIGDALYVEIGIGTSDNEPNGSLYNLEGTQVYVVTYIAGSLHWEPVRTITSATSWCSRGDCTGQDMQGTPCEVDSKPLASKVINGYRGEPIGLLKLMTSVSCGANWAVVNVYGKNPKVAYASILRPSDNGWWHENWEFKTMGVRTHMVFAPVEPVEVCGYVDDDNYRVCIAQ